MSLLTQPTHVWFSNAVAAVQAGERDRARDLLRHVVQVNDEHLQAWLWLAGLAEDRAEQHRCLEKVFALTLGPNYEPGSAEPPPLPASSAGPAAPGRSPHPGPQPPLGRARASATRSPTAGPPPPPASNAGPQPSATGPQSLLAGAGHVRVSSFHDWAIDRVGDGLRVVGIAEDNVTEALERPDRTLVLGTQWHPEVPPRKIEYFERLIEEAKRYRQRRTAESK